MNDEVVEEDRLSLCGMQYLPRSARMVPTELPWWLFVFEREVQTAEPDNACSPGSLLG